MLDRTYTAQQLQQLAIDHPELWSEILNHPNCYPALAQWINASRMGQQNVPANLPSQAPKSSNPQPLNPQPVQVGPAYTTQPQVQPANQPIYPQQINAQLASRQPSPKKSKKGLIAVVSLLVLVVVAAIVLVAISIFPLGSSSGGQNTNFSKSALVRSTELPENINVLSFYSYGDKVLISGENDFYSWDDRVTKFDQTIHKEMPVGVVETRGQAEPDKAIPMLASDNSKIPWLPNSTNPKEPITVTEADLVGPKPVSGGNEKQICRQNGKTVECGEIGKDQPSQSIEASVDWEPLGAFPLDDGMAAVLQDFRSPDLKIVIKPLDGSPKEITLDDGVFVNVLDFLGLNEWGKVRQVPVPSTGLSVEKLTNALESKAHEIHVVDGKVCMLPKQNANQWVCEGVTYEGLSSPLLVEGSDLVGTAGGSLGPDHRITGATMIVVFDKSGQIIRAYPLAGPSKVWTSAGKIYTVLMGEDGQAPKLFEYGGTKGEEAKSETDVKLPSPPDPDMLKGFDFGNFTSSEPDPHYEKPWDMKNGFWDIDKGVYAKLIPERIQYVDLDNDGILDAFVPTVNCYDMHNDIGCSLANAVFLANPNDEKPLYVGFVDPNPGRGNWGTTEADVMNYMDGNLYKVKDGKLLAPIPFAPDNGHGDSVLKVWRPTRTFYFENPLVAYPNDNGYYADMEKPLLNFEGRTLRVAPDDNAPLVEEKLDIGQVFNDKDPRSHKNGYTFVLAMDKDSECYTEALDTDDYIGPHCYYAAWVKDQ